MQNTQDILDVLQSQEDVLLSAVLNDLVETHRKGEGRRAYDLWNRYTLKDVPIYKRKPAAYEKVDRRTANDFFADIVDTKTGYMGNEVSIILNREAYKADGVLNEELYEADKNILRMFQLMTSSEDKNSDQVRRAGATGIGYRLLYVPQDRNEVRIKNLPAWEVIYVYDQSIDEPQLVLRYYTIEDVEFKENGKHTTERTVVEWYDDKHVTFFIDDGEGHYVLDRSRGAIEEIDGEERGTGRIEHLFNEIPIIPFPNNELLTAEPEKVVDLIDAYDAIISSTTSEVEQLRLAYMFLKGAGLDLGPEYIRQLEQTGVFALPEDGEVGFVTKQLADAPVHNILAEIRRNIYQFAKSIDMSKDFGGEMRVIGWQVALLNLENSAKITERKFTRALRKQYQLITDYWRRNGFDMRGTVEPADIDPYTLEFTFTRNFPRDLHAEAETLLLLLQAVSKETAFAQMSFIDDPEAEIQKIENEDSPYRGIDDPGPGEEQQEVEAGA